MPYLYAAIPISTVPYPEGLCKAGPSVLLERDMQALLGADHLDADANAEAFWTPPYQDLISRHLAPYFDERGPIVEVARAALELARTSPGYGRVLADGDEYEGHGAHLPKSRYADDLFAQKVRSWASSPPALYPDSDRPDQWAIGDGRHRLSYLRSIVEPADARFPVLVRLGWDEDAGPAPVELSR